MFALLRLIEKNQATDKSGDSHDDVKHILDVFTQCIPVTPGRNGCEKLLLAFETPLEMPPPYISVTPFDGQVPL